MFLPINNFIADEVIFDDIFEAPIISEQAQLDDMIAEFLPLHRLIAIDIDFFEKINEGECQFHFEFLVGAVVVEVFEHD